MRQFLHRESPWRLRCVDDRQADDLNGVELPGATYVVVDGMKRVLGLTEWRAWEEAQRHGIPISGHTDNHHHGRHRQGHGCLYAVVVEQEPHVVGAPESVRADERLETVRALGGTVTTYFGSHPTNSLAVLNWIKDYSLDPDRLRLNGIYAFNADAWAADVYARQLDLSIKDAFLFKRHIVHAYKRLIHNKIGIPRMVVLRPSVADMFRRNA